MTDCTCSTQAVSLSDVLHFCGQPLLSTVTIQVRAERECAQKRSAERLQRRARAREAEGRRAAAQVRRSKG